MFPLTTLDFIPTRFRSAEDMKILVTGATGKIGHATALLLMERGHEVYATDLNRWKDEPRAHHFTIANLIFSEACLRVVEGMERVVHLGEIPNSVRGITSAELFQRNTQIGSNMLSACQAYGVKRVVYASSCQAYGMNFGNLKSLTAPLTLPFDETHPLRPENPYGAAKAAVEAFAHNVTAGGETGIACMRFPAVAWAFHSWKKWWNTSPDYVPPDFGIYVNLPDAALAIALAVESDKMGFEAYHTTAERVCLRTSLREYLAQHFPHYPALPTDWPEDHSPMLSAKIREHFGWAPSSDKPLWES